VPLEAVARVSRSLGPLTVNHLGQLPAVTLSFNLKPGTALGDAVSEVDRVARATLPGTITTSFQGTAQAFEASSRGLGWLLLLAILVIYIVLGILYESFIHPITILSGLPAAGLGALLTLLIFRQDLSLYAFVGVIMLVGIVKKNAIMMIDFALDAQRREGRSPAEAIYQGCLIRFRPIMMTTMAAHGHAAHRPRRRRGGGVAPPAGPGRGGGPPRLPAADALHHPGLLHVHGVVPGLAPAPGAGEPGRGPSDGPLTTLAR
jgi:HAE1 family hydrophobic/amphiphilic exporter-1